MPIHSCSPSATAIPTVGKSGAI